MYYQRSSAFIGGLQSDRHRSLTTVWPQMNADKRRFARDLLRLSSYFLDTTLGLANAGDDHRLLGGRRGAGGPGSTAARSRAAGRGMERGLSNRRLETEAGRDQQPVAFESFAGFQIVRRYNTGLGETVPLTDHRHRLAAA